MPVALDITGHTYGRLTVLRRALPATGRNPRWVCVCSCGVETLASAGELRYRHKQSCGCLHRETHPVPPTRDLTGQRFGRLVVQSLGGRSAKGENLWRCLCDCGKETTPRISRLTAGKTKSCGCLAADQARSRVRTDFAEHFRRTTKPSGEASAWAIYTSYQRAAPVRGLTFTLSLDVFKALTQSACQYCGIPPSNTYRGRRMNGPYVYNGIDRVDSRLGYIDGNVVPCCSQCNNAKRALSVAEFYAWIDRVSRHRGAGLGDRAS